MITTGIAIPNVPGLVRIAYRADVPVLLKGAHGIGKSAVLKQAAEEMGIKALVFDLSLLEAVDLLGIPYTENGETRYAPPARLPRRGRGILLLEELNRASPQTRAPALELLTTRQLHDYALPKGWLPCASVNPSGDGYEVDALDPALLSRFMVLRVEADHHGWLDWARREGIHPVIQRYVEASPDIFAQSDVNPRALEYSSNFLKAFEAGEDPRDQASVLAVGWSGLLGVKVATALLRFYQGTETAPTPKEILDDYPAVRPSVVCLVEGGRLDLVRSSVLRLQKHLQRQKHWDDARRSQTAVSNLRGFLDDIPADMRKEFDEWLEGRGYELEQGR